MKKQNQARVGIKTFFYQLLRTYFPALIRQQALVVNRQRKHNRDLETDLSMHTCKWNLQTNFQFFFLSW